MKKRVYLSSGNRSWGSEQGFSLKKLLRPVRWVLFQIFRAAKAVLLSVYRLIWKLLVKIPFFKKLERRGRKSPLYWLNVGATLVLMGVIFSSLVLGFTFVVFSKDLPSPDRLSEREVSMSTKIYDRKGRLLYDIYGDENRTLVTIDQIPDIVKQAAIAIEDKHFYTHRGFDPIGMARGIYRTVAKGDTQGGSSITQQLVKNTLLTSERTVTRKIKEFILAIQIEARYSKDEILQMYFNETPYGGQAIGIQAAAENYFGKNVDKLTLAEAALLAGLPQAPSRYSPFRDPELAKWRQGEVLRRMREDGYITVEEEETALAQKLKFKSEGSQIQAPHFVMYVKELLAERYGETFVETGGLRVTTTLDLSLQNKHQKFVRDEIANDKIYQVSNGALMSVNPQTGEILTMVGSKNYFATDIDGQFNVTTSPSRQPGSSIKPITYVTAFKQGFSPASVLVGVPTSFNVGTGQPLYKPQNFANRNYGLLTIRKALGNSLNIPAVKTLSLVGLDNMLDTAADMGITTLTDRGRYGIALTLGGGEVKMIDMVAAFSVFATGGVRHDPVAILKVTDHNGNILEQFKSNSGVRVLSEQQTYLINDILSDFNSRTLTFGGGTQLGLNIPGHTVAVKTGTTNDNRDNWAIGYTPAHKGSKVSIAIAAWIGNNDNKPMNPNFFAGAARIWNAAMVDYLNGKPDVGFQRPKDIVGGKVDALSGMAPGPYTQGTISDIFINGTVPTEPDNWHLRLKICKPDGLLASDACIAAGQAVDKNYIKIRAEKSEWQKDVDAWVKKVYAGKSQYFPPTKTSTLCFNSSGQVVSCTSSGAGPLINNSDVSFYQYPPSEAQFSKVGNQWLLSSNFEVRVTPNAQQGTSITWVWFWLEGAGCNVNKCNQGPPSGVAVTDSGGYKSSSKGFFQGIPLGTYTLKIVAEDDAGGITNPVYEVSITVSTP